MFATEFGTIFLNIFRGDEFEQGNRLVEDLALGDQVKQESSTTIESTFEQDFVLFSSFSFAQNVVDLGREGGNEGFENSGKESNQTSKNSENNLGSNFFFKS